MGRKWRLDFPFDKVVEKAKRETADGRILALQKFTCEHCGQRLTMDVPNEFFTEGTCDKCGKLTDIRKHGCNYALVSNTPVMRSILRGEPVGVKHHETDHVNKMR